MDLPSDGGKAWTFKEETLHLQYFGIILAEGSDHKGLWDKRTSAPFSKKNRFPSKCRTGLSRYVGFTCRVKKTQRGELLCA